MDNQLLSDGTYNYTYDGEGNRISRTNIATGALTLYTWDYRNRLTRILDEDSAGRVVQEVDYTYDAEDRRIVASVTQGTGVPSVTQYVYDGDHPVLSLDGAGAVQHRYLYGPAVDQVLADEDRQGNVLWTLADNEGTVRDLIDSSGVVHDHLSYDAFGNIRAQTNPSAWDGFGYTGRESDPSTGLVFDRARYYDPAAGLFLSPDPLGFGGGDTNPTRYVANDPINATDPTGMEESLGSQGGELSADAGLTANIVNTGISQPSRIFTQRIIQGASSFFQQLQSVPLTLKGTLVLQAQGMLLVGAGVGLAGLGILGGVGYGVYQLIQSLQVTVGTFPQVEDLERGTLVQTLKPELQALNQSISPTANAQALEQGQQSPCDYYGLTGNTKFNFTYPRQRPNNPNITDNLGFGAVASLENPIPAGTETNKSSTRLARMYGYGYEDAGHILGRQLGGLGGSKSGNIFPQDPATNQEIYRTYENSIAAGVKALPKGGASACVLIGLLNYPAYPAFRPLNITYATWGLPDAIDAFRVFGNPPPAVPTAPAATPIPLSTDPDFDPSAPPDDPTLI